MGSWHREVPLSGWFTPLVWTKSGEEGHGGVPYIKYQRKGGPTLITEKNLVDTVYRLVGELAGVIKDRKISGDELIYWKFTYVVGKNLSVEGARDAYLNDKKDLRKTEHHVLGKRVRDLPQLIDNLLYSFQNTMAKYPGDYWFCSIEFTIRFASKDTAPLIKEGVYTP